MPVNQAKLDKMKQQQESSRIGGKGTVRRKKKHVHTRATDDKRLQVRNSSIMIASSHSSLLSSAEHSS